MKLNPGEPIFDDVPSQYFSPFPHLDTLLEKKYSAFTEASKGNSFKEELAVMQVGRAFTDALAICNKTKAVVVGDLLNDWLPKVAWMGKGSTGNIPMGLFAEIPWGHLASMRPDEIVKVFGNAGLTLAMSALSAVPVYGQIAAGLMAAGRAMFRLFEAKASDKTKRLVLPWANFSKPKDEDFVNLVRDTIFRKVDWTEMFAPPFDLDPWRVALYKPGKKDLNAEGLIWMPTTPAGTPAWGSGLGCMPGTNRIAGQVQGLPPESPGGTLMRHMRRPKGVTPRSVRIPWRQELIDCGDYFPSLAQLGAATWQQIQAAGNPDMYKVRAFDLDGRWKAYFDNLYASGQQGMYDAGGSIGQIVGYDSYQAANLVSQLVEPYLCYRLTPTSPWMMGAPAGYRPHSLFHKGIFQYGPGEFSVPPGDQTQRNECLFVETDTPKSPDEPIWPYGGSPEEHPSLRPGSYQPSTTPATTDPPKGYRCIPFPTQELANAAWTSPYEAFIRPQLQALAQRQISCLESTLVCAYVRPVGYDDLPAYAAFTGGGGADGLRKKCLDVRAQLLKNSARFLVDLRDVDSIDPKFADDLRKSGVTNSPQQKSTAKINKLVAGPVDAKGNLIPPAPPNGGGSAFEDQDDHQPSSGGGGGGLILGLASAGLVIVGGVALMNRRRNVRR